MKAEFNIAYYLWTARKNKKGLAPVYISSRQNSTKLIRYNTGLKIHASQWSEPRREPKNKPAILLELEGKLKATYRDLVAQGYEPNLADLLKHLNDPRKPTGKSIIEWCDDYLAGNYSDGQKKAVRTLKANIDGFQKSLTFDRLNKARLRAFFEYLTEQGVANNSQYKRLRALVNVADHANLDIPDLRTYRLPYSTKNALKTRLTWPEVKAVMETEPLTEIEATAKDVFLLACFSGLRIGDILTIQKGELNEHHYERLQTKTKQTVLVTLHRYNEALFRKFMTEGVSYSRQRMSDALKDVLERSGMTKEITRYQQVGNIHREITAPKFKEISFHSGRRFYARLLSDLGLGEEITRDELGHGFKSVTELYAGSQEHIHRLARVRKAMETMEQTMEQHALMKVA